MTNRIRKFPLILFIIYLATLAYCCFGHFGGLPNVKPYLFGFRIDKVIHFIMFFPFPILFFLAFVPHSDKIWKAVLSVFLVLLLGCIVAASTEVGQSYTTYRSGDVKDFEADAISLCISSFFTLIFVIIKQIRGSRK